jgi:uncharacterized protein
MLFHSPTLGPLLFDEVIEVCRSFIAVDADAEYHVTIGSDSEQRSGIVECISAIVIHRVGRGARYFWRRERHKPFHTLRERIWFEAMQSTSLAKHVLDAFTEREAWRSARMIVHVDVGKNGPTKVLIQEISGYVQAYGFTVAIKPDAYAAFSVADKYT